MKNYLKNIRDGVQFFLSCRLSWTRLQKFFREFPKKFPNSYRWLSLALLIHFRKGYTYRGRYIICLRLIRETRIVVIIIILIIVNTWKVRFTTVLICLGQSNWRLKKYSEMANSNNIKMNDTLTFLYSLQLARIFYWSSGIWKTEEILGISPESRQG